MYFVELSVKTQDFLKKLDSGIVDRIEKRLKILESNPIPSDSKFIGRENGDKVFRFRIGDYRALYKVLEKEKIVLISKIDKRNKVYD